MRFSPQADILDTQLVSTHALFFCELSMFCHSLLGNHIGRKQLIESGFLCGFQEWLRFQNIFHIGHILSSPCVQPFKMST